MSFHARTFTNADDLKAHYRAVLARRDNPRAYVAPAVVITPEPEPEPVDTSPATWIPDGSPDAMELYEKIINAPGWNARATANRMVEEIAAKHGVTAADIMGQSRKRKMILARFEAVALVATTFRGWSLPVLGRFFGNRDHSTILHALRVMGVDRS